MSSLAIGRKENNIAHCVHLLKLAERNTMMNSSDVFSSSSKKRSEHGSSVEWDVLSN